MMSTWMPIVLFAGAIWGAYTLAGFYGVAIAASAMMATTAMQLAIDAFGPIADNAGGIAEMSELPKEVREKTDVLDSVGNTTAAIGKGFAIASAALTALGCSPLTWISRASRASIFSKPTYSPRCSWAG
jgi:K(+)-stimulated pyrophosphate-energized sodium pump